MRRNAHFHQPSPCAAALLGERRQVGVEQGTGLGPLDDADHPAERHGQHQQRDADQRDQQPGRRRTAR